VQVPIAVHAPSPGPEFIARMPQGAGTGPLSPVERPAPPELALTAAVTPFAPQAPVPAPVYHQQVQQQQLAQQRNQASDTQRVINLLDTAIVVCLGFIIIFLMRKFGIADA